MAWASDYPWGMDEGEFEERLRVAPTLGRRVEAVESTRMTFATTGDRLAEDASFVEWLAGCSDTAPRPATW